MTPKTRKTVIDLINKAIDANRVMKPNTVATCLSTARSLLKKSKQRPPIYYCIRADGNGPKLYLSRGWVYNTEYEGWVYRFKKGKEFRTVFLEKTGAKEYLQNVNHEDAMKDLHKKYPGAQFKISIVAVY